MLQSLSYEIPQPQMDCASELALKVRAEDRYNRNEEEDMQTAITYLYDFKRKIDKLHPNCLRLVDQMLQNNHRIY